jgi:GrpB-like predicted nucleotidyltransferase (UPF0157 family)
MCSHEVATPGAYGGLGRGHPAGMADPFGEHVALSDADPRWAQRYVDEAARIGAALAGIGASIEHIGSTSVPLRGKPIVDIQVGVPEARRAGTIAALEAAGYAHHGEGGIPGRDYLTRRASPGAGFNVHVFAAGDTRLADNRAIRDYLRAHPDAAREYVRTKEDALRRGHADLLSYSDHKHDRVAAIRDAAREWARETIGP